MTKVRREELAFRGLGMNEGSEFAESDSDEQKSGGFDGWRGVDVAGGAPG